MSRRLLLALPAALFAAALALTSCATAPPIADGRERGVPDGVELEPFSTGPAAIAREDGSVQVVTWGSGSCPPTATAFENDGRTLEIAFATDTAGPCSADRAPTTHTFSADTVGGSVPDVVRLVFPEFGEEQLVDVIRE